MPAPQRSYMVEISAGGGTKYEFNAEAGLMVLDRVLHSSVRYPFDYGFIPNTLAEDGAPLDAMVIMDEPTFAGCLIAARPIGILDMVDCGAHDGKLLCVPAADPRQREMAYRAGVNIVMYTLTGNYKADQVHIPALLERLGN